MKNLIPVKANLLFINGTCIHTPVSNPRMAKWPQHSTETFESIPRGKPQNGRATYGVRESLSFVYFESYLHDFFLNDREYVRLSRTSVFLF